MTVKIDLPDGESVSVDKLTSWAKDVRVPGILWVVGLVLAVWAIETYVPTETLQRWLEIAPVAIFALGKFTTLGKELAQAEALIQIIRVLQNKLPPTIRSSTTRAGEVVEVPVQTAILTDDQLDKMQPNPVMRLLAG